MSTEGDNEVMTEISPSTPDNATPLPDKRKRLIAGGLSFVWPGIGQLTLGERRAGLGFAIPAAVLAIVAAIQVVANPVLFAFSLWDQTYLFVVVLAVVFFGIWRVAAVLHAIFGGMPRPWRRFDMAIAAVLVAAVALVHVAAAGGAVAWYRASVDIQQNDVFADASPTALPSAASPSGEPSPTDDPTSMVTVLPDSSNEPTAEVTKTPNPNRLTFLLVGVDFTAGRTHSLTDTLMIASLDRSTHKAALVSVPRDTSSFPFYWGGMADNTTKLNTFLNLVTQGRLHAPDKPMVALEKEIGFLVGIPVNYYAAVNMDGFAGVIDTMGGLDVYNPNAINDPATGIILPAGRAHLNGAQAVLYARSRENGGSDYIRANRQQGMLLALKNKLLSARVLPKFNTILSIASRSVSTDFPLKTAKDYVKDLQGVTVISNCVLGPPYSIHPSMTQTGGKWTSYLDMNLVAGLSVDFFGKDSLYYGDAGVAARDC